MPFASEAQRGWMWAHHPEMAREWQAHTSPHAHLPEHVSKHAAAPASNQAVVVPGVNIFDEHEETDPTGQPLRRFDRAALEQIAARSNARSQAQPCPLTIGHTRDNVPETEQPEIVGYARNFRVAYSAGLGRHVLQADFHLHPDRADYARQFPRVSVELWPKDGIIDPVALLRRTPQRDLGQWTYGRHPAGLEVVRYSMGDWDYGRYGAEQNPPSPHGLNGTAPGGPPPMVGMPPQGGMPMQGMPGAAAAAPPPSAPALPDSLSPAAPPDSGAPDPADMEKFMRCMKYFMSMGSGGSSGGGLGATGDGMSGASTPPMKMQASDGTSGFPDKRTVLAQNVTLPQGHVGSGPLPNTPDPWGLNFDQDNQPQQAQYQAGPGFPGGGNTFIPGFSAGAGQKRPEHQQQYQRGESVTQEQLEAVHRAALALGYSPPQQPQRYAAGNPNPAVPQSVTPGSTTEEERLRMQYAVDRIRYERQQQELLHYQRESARAACQAIVQGLVFEGKDLDVATEVEALIPLSEPDRQARAEYVRRYYKDSIDHAAPWIEGQPNRFGRAAETTADERNAAVRLATETNCSYDEALRTVRGQN